MSGLAKHKRCKLDPAINLGYSYKFNNNILLGISVECSFGKSNDEVVLNSKELRGISKIRGCSPALKSKAGYVFEGLKTSIYATAGIKNIGISYAIDEDDSASDAVKQNKVVPVFGVGVERRITSHISAGCEYECFWKKANHYDVSLTKLPEDIASQTYRIKQGLHGNSLRIGLRYYF